MTNTRIEKFRFDSAAPSAIAMQRSLCNFYSSLLPNFPVNADFDLTTIKGPTIFLLDANSLLDYTMLAENLQQHGIAAPVYIGSFAPRMFIPKPPSYVDPKEGVCVHHLKLGDHVALPMQTPADIFAPASFKSDRNHNQELLHLYNWLKQQKQQGHEINIVPFVCLWSREAKHIFPTLGDRIFGDNSAPGLLRRAFQILYNLNLSRLFIGSPVDLDDLLETDSKEDVRIQKLKKYFSRSLSGLRRIATGPMQKWKSKTIELVIRDRQLTKTMALLAKRENATMEELQERAREILSKCAAEFSTPHTGMVHWILQLIYKLCFDGFVIDEEGFNKLRKVATKGHPLIILPTHKSHMDYLIVSDVFYERGLIPPHIAAGSNLAFWPFGYMFRKAGAYFIRRQIGTDLLYARVLEAYVRRLIRDGYNQEFFLEGGRSRDGKQIEPKVGLLAMTANTYFDEVVKNIYYVPIGIVYDKIMEDESYVKEMRGGAKSKESFFQVLRSLTMLRRRYGRVHVNFGEPISLKKLARENFKEGEKLDKRALVKSLAMQVTHSINFQTAITTNSLNAITLLSHLRIALDEEEILDTTRVLLSFVKVKGIPCPLTLEDPRREIQKSLNMLIDFDIVERIHAEGKPYYQVIEGRRHLLSIYKNMVLHHFLPQALLAMAIPSHLTVIPRELLTQRLYILRQALKAEFVDLLDDRMEDEAFTDHCLDWFATHGYTEAKNNSIQLKQWQQCYLANILRPTLAPFVESLFVVNDLMAQLHDQSSSAPPELGSMHERWQQLYLRGRVIYPEANNKLSLERASHSLRDLLSGNGKRSAKNFDDFHALKDFFEEMLKPHIIAQREQRDAAKSSRPQPPRKSQ